MIGLILAAGIAYAVMWWIRQDAKPKTGDQAQQTTNEFLSGVTLIAIIGIAITGAQLGLASLHEFKHE